MIVYDIQKLTKRYDGQATPANDQISLQINQGEIFGFLGDNGAGKSTLVKQMVNLLRPTAGQVLLHGQPVSAHPQLTTLHVGYMPQSWQALNHLTVGEAIYFTAHLRGLDRRAARAERERLLVLWQLEPLRNKVGRHLSGGERRLLQISIAMAGNPPILMLDEPTNELSPQRRRQVWNALRDLNRTQGTTIIFITHDAIEAEKIIQRVGILHAGRLVALGTPGALKQQVDQQLRLELFFAPETPPMLPPELVVQPLDAGRWMVYVERSHLESVMSCLDQNQIDDFRFYSATLEDLYIHYATEETAAG
ncbi:MAG: ABC transporter ATP-binding protein [Caldilineaceae bacterium]|nr:ABC transporter ATP-binding protein [Caldilineaceae bacterium]MCB0145220.1 ABC transporter ATP-binding protein [Caldilineaceae bacterium]